jgi:hypothetical protein
MRVMRVSSEAMEQSIVKDTFTTSVQTLVWTRTTILIIRIVSKREIMEVRSLRGTIGLQRLGMYLFLEFNIH